MNSADGTLVVKDLVIGDRGTYQCQGRSTEGTTGWHSTKVYVEGTVLYVYLLILINRNLESFTLHTLPNKGKMK